MPFFSRRRIQKMVDELSLHLQVEKRRDIVQRLNSKDPEQSVGAEMELAITWSLTNFDMEVEPFWWGAGKSPDIYVEGLIPDRPMVVEVTAFADSAISGETQMDHCAQVFCNLATQTMRDSGNRLYFNFAETREYSRGRYERGIAAPKDYSPTEGAARKFKEWISTKPTAGSRLSLEDGGLIVQIEMRANKQVRYHNYHVSRPPRTYSNTRNPLYRRLDEKAKQVAKAPPGVFRMVLLVESGSRFLAEIASKSGFITIENYSTAKDIIRKFIYDKSDSLDAVVVLVPRVEHARSWLGKTGRSNYWSSNVFCTESRDTDSITVAMEKIVANLPPPKFDGYSVRSLIRQKALQHKSRGWYRGASISMKENSITYRMSSRAFQDFLAKRIDETQFRRFIGDGEDGPSIGRFLDQGFTVQKVHFEVGGIDEDDDTIILEFARDAAAGPFE